MWLRIWKSISGAESAVFVSSLPLDDAVRSLATVVERSEFANWGVDCLVGHVTIPKVRIARHRAGQRTSTRPVFRGRFREDAGRTVLDGRFAYPWTTRLLLLASVAVLAVFVLALAVLGAAVLAANGHRDATFWMAVVALMLSVTLAAALSRVTQPFEREDIAWISERVQTSMALPNNRIHPAAFGRG